MSSAGAGADKVRNSPFRPFVFGSNDVARADGSDLPSRSAAAQPPAAQPPPTQPAAAQSEAPPLTSGDDDSDAEAGASSGLSSAAKADLANRFMEGKALGGDAQHYNTILLHSGIAALVSEVKSEKPKEEDADVWSQAMSFACNVLHADNFELSLPFLDGFLETRLVPEVIDAAGKFRHCSKVPCKALTLLNKILGAALDLSKVGTGPLPPADTRAEELWQRLSVEVTSGVDVCLSALSLHSSDSTVCAAGFEFLAAVVRKQAVVPANLVALVVKHGERAVSACLAALRTHRSAPKIVYNAASTLKFMAVASDEMAMLALEQDAVKLLIEATPAPVSSRTSRQCTPQYKVAAQCIAEIFRASFFDGVDPALASRLQVEAVSSGVVECLVTALRAGVAGQGRVLPILLLCCAQKPAYAMRAIKAGALELEDEPGSTDVRTFVNRLKSLMDDAEASADAAAAELLAGEDAARARTAKAKAKRKKKPAASLDALPPAAEIDIAESAGEQPPADRGSAFELSQSESALRRRRRAATKAARRTAAVERARGGGKQPAESSSSDADDDEPSGAGDELPPLPSFLAELRAPARGGSASSPAADAPPPAEMADRGSLAELFPWLAAPVSAAARAAAAPTPAAAPSVAAAAAMPLPEHAASKPERAVMPPLRPASPGAVSDAASSRAAQRDVPLPPLPPSEPPPSLPPLPASQNLLLERFTAQSAELARVKDELARVQDELDASKCVICLCAPRCVAMLPCRHLPLCASPECAAMMGSPPLCPLCRVRVADTMQLFV
jgi:hypothetical protein